MKLLYLSIALSCVSQLSMCMIENSANNSTTPLSDKLNSPRKQPLMRALLRTAEQQVSFENLASALIQQNNEIEIQSDTNNQPQDRKELVESQETLKETVSTRNLRKRKAPPVLQQSTKKFKKSLTKQELPNNCVLLNITKDALKKIQSRGYKYTCPQQNCGKIIPTSSIEEGKRAASNHHKKYHAEEPFSISDEELIKVENDKPNAELQKDLYVQCVEENCDFTTNEPQFTIEEINYRLNNHYARTHKQGFSKAQIISNLIDPTSEKKYVQLIKKNN